MSKEISGRCALLFAVLLSAACASAPGTTPVVAQTPSDTTRTLAPARDTLPVGFGSLKQDEVTLSIRTGALLLKVTPLTEDVTRLLAPDTYPRLHALAETRRDEASRGIGTRELFLVSFYSYQPDVTFPIDYQQEIVLRYGMEESAAWRTIISKLQVERAKVKSRAGR